MFENMLDSLIYNATLIEKIPFMFFCAVGFYCSAIIVFVCCLFNRQFRNRVFSIFSSPRPSTGVHMLSLDTLRGLAILGVASYHSWQWFQPFNEAMIEFTPIAQGYKGVTLFVVLSGFLIYRSVKYKCSSLDDISDYGKRRLLRIYPLYFTNVIVLLLLGFINSSPSTIQNFSAAAFMLYPLKHPLIVYSPAWSLYVEVIFYISLPIWVAVTKKYPLMYSVIALSIFSITGGHVPHELQIIRYLFMGIVTSEILDRFKINQSVAGIMLMAGSGLIYLDFQGHDIFAEFIVKSFSLLDLNLILDTSLYCSITLLIALPLILIGAIKFPPAYKFLGFYPFRFIGIISYSIFMWHGVMLMSIGRMGGSPGGEGIFYGDIVTLIGIYWPAFLFVGTVSYALIERPFQKWRPN